MVRQKLLIDLTAKYSGTLKKGMPNWRWEGKALAEGAGAKQAAKGNRSVWVGMWGIKERGLHITLRVLGPSHIETRRTADGNAKVVRVRKPYHTGTKKHSKNLNTIKGLCFKKLFKRTDEENVKGSL